MSSHAPLLLELGTEELPAGSVVPMSQALADGLAQQLRDAGFDIGAARSYATPRRLACLIDAVPAQQADRSVEQRGPSVSAAFDGDGQATKAALGFAKRFGVDVSALQRVSTDKGEWLVHRYTEPGKSLEQLLQDIVPELLAQLPQPKKMRWADRKEQFLRPVSWMVCLHGSTVLPIEALGLRASANSQGHRFHAPGPLPLSQASDYCEALRAAQVLADVSERREQILQQVQASAAALGVTARIDPELLDEVTALVEWPVAVTGRFESHFLEVPKEAIVLTLQKDQRYFCLENDDGSLYPGFITLSNIDSQDVEQVRAGNERVVRPRLADAMFFYTQDRKMPLASHIESLRDVVFQKQLGTLYDKTERLVRLTRHIAQQLQVDAVLVERAAWLSQCDLMTKLVYEFPELQGIAGRHYIYHEGESDAVASALEEQYLPRHAGDATAAGAVGQVLSLATKLDTLTGIFAIGQRPSGTKDPFGLRRAALSVLRLCIERGLDLDLAELVAEGQHTHAVKLGDASAASESLAYILERLPNYYAEQGIDGAAIDAAIASGSTRPVDLDRRVQALVQFRQLPECEALTAAVKRCANILKKTQLDETPRVDTALLQDDAERTLARTLEALQVPVHDAFAAGDYEGALRQLSSLKAPVDQFFESVMVMVDDPALRQNRLALLHSLHQLCSAVGDISRL